MDLLYVFLKHDSLHMKDLHRRYFQNPPRYQILHCLRNRVEGGKSIFVDGLHAALQMHQTLPADFGRLVKSPVNFHYINDGHHLHCEHRTIELEHKADISPNAVSIKCLNYSPPFQAPLPASTSSSFFSALKKFAALLDAPERRFEYLLREGDAVVFDNRRILHGRTSFADTGADAAEGETNRWLKGCYLEEDAFLDRRRVLSARFDEGNGLRQSSRGQDSASTKHVIASIDSR